MKTFIKASENTTILHSSGRCWLLLIAFTLQYTYSDADRDMSLCSGAYVSDLCGLFLSGWLCAVETVPCPSRSLTRTWTTSLNAGCWAKAQRCTWSSRPILPPSLCFWRCDTRVSGEALRGSALIFTTYKNTTTVCRCTSFRASFCIILNTCVSILPKILFQYWNGVQWAVYKTKAFFSLNCCVRDVPNDLMSYLQRLFTLCPRFSGIYFSLWRSSSLFVKQ